jgi:glycosyltransferase involved in cell wall biosynthesis
MISVVVPAYNAEETLEQCLNSIQNSFSVEDYEVIIVDDGSVNSCDSIVSKFPHNFKYIRTENNGVSAARNVGAKASTGEIIAFCDSDDVWLLDKMSTQLDIFLSQKMKILGAGSVGRIYKLAHEKKLFYIKKQQLPIQWWPHISTVIISADFFYQVGGFDEGMRYAEDGDFLVRVSQKVDIPVLVHDLVRHDIHKSFNFSSGLSSNQKSMLKGELKIIKKYYHTVPALMFSILVVMKYVSRNFLLLFRNLSK